ncbi:hypothetical protein CR513_01548, partial [Mucuna pruriens]
MELSNKPVALIFHNRIVTCVGGGKGTFNSSSFTHSILRKMCLDRNISNQLNTPYILLFGKTPNYEHLRSFGCVCYRHVNTKHRDEFEP